MNPAAALAAIQNDERYQRNLAWGKPRRGHPEGTVAAHIAELEANLERLRSRLSADEIAKLLLLIHTHDSFKADAVKGVAINHPRSHASLARAFLAEFTDDADLLAMVQWHDEPFALYRQYEHRGSFNAERLDALLANIRDWDLFSAFLIIDGGTAGKSREPLDWFFPLLHGRRKTRFTPGDLP